MFHTRLLDLLRLLLEGFLLYAFSPFLGKGARRSLYLLVTLLYIYWATVCTTWCTCRGTNFLALSHECLRMFFPPLSPLAEALLLLHRWGRPVFCVPWFTREGRRFLLPFPRGI